MDFIQLLVLQFIAHLLTDFYFQPDKKAKEKNDLGFKSKFLKWHILIVFGFSWVFSFQLNFIFASIAIAFTHWAVDGVKKHLNSNHEIGKWAFFIDQILHVVFIILIVYLFNKYFEIKTFFTIPISIKYLLMITGYVICATPANIIIKEVIYAFDISITDNNDLPNAGKLIGIIERILVLTFVLLNQFELVGFLIAAKSILRYKNDKTIKTEYVLIGTMLSFGIAIVLGILINFI